MSKSICLSMIVKDHEKSLDETLKSFIEHFSIDYFVFIDLGSTDSTVNILRNFMIEYKIPGKIYQETKGSHTDHLNKCFQYASGITDYILFMNPNYQIKGTFDLPELTADQYFFKINHQDKFFYHNNLLVRNTDQFKWQGNAHRFIVSEQPFSTAYIEGDYVIEYNQVENYIDIENDLETMENAFFDEEKTELKANYAQFLGTKYFDLANYEEATKWFKRRLTLSDTESERLDAYFKLGLSYKQMEQPQEAIYYWLKGYDFNPSKVDCLYKASELFMEEENYQLAYQLGLLAKQHLRSDEDTQELLWIDYLLSICSYYVSDHKQGIESSLNVIAQSSFDWMIVQIIKNLHYYQEHLDQLTQSQFLQLITQIEKYKEYDQDIEQIFDQIGLIFVRKYINH